MKRLTRIITAVLILGAGRSAMAIEQSLEQLLSSSARLEELRLQRDIDRLTARETGLVAIPELYLAAPSAYSTNLPPEGQHSWAATVGVRQELPFGIAADVSVQPALVRRDPETVEATEFTEEQVIPGGFIHSLSAEAGLSVPVYATPYINLPLAIQRNALERASAAHDLSTAQIVRAFVTDWFALYRQSIEYERAVRAEAQAIAAAGAHAELVERGEAASHVQWEYQRRVFAAETERVQLHHALESAKASLYVRHGVFFPDDPQLPPDDFSWSNYGVAPLHPSVTELNELNQEADELTFHRTRQMSAPKVSVSFGLTGPTQTEAGAFAETFSDQFRDWDDWSPSLAVGFSLSSRDVLAASIERRRHERSVALSELETRHLYEQRRVEAEQLSELLSRYERMHELEKTALAQMRAYLADMRVQLEEGVIDLLTFQEVEAAVANIETAVEIADSHVIETELLLALLTGTSN